MIEFKKPMNYLNESFETKEAPIAFIILIVASG
jgi:hypothetical protein